MMIGFDGNECVVGRVYSTPAPPPLDPNAKVFCFVCRKPVPKKEVTEAALRFGRGLCSKKCSKIMRKTYGDIIPNRHGRFQVRIKRKDNKSKKEILAASFGVRF